MNDHTNFVRSNPVRHSLDFQYWSDALRTADECNSLHAHTVRQNRCMGWNCKCPYIRWAFNVAVKNTQQLCLCFFVPFSVSTCPCRSHSILSMCILYYTRIQSNHELNVNVWRSDCSKTKCDEMKKQKKNKTKLYITLRSLSRRLSVGRSVDFIVYCRVVHTPMIVHSKCEACACVYCKRRHSKRTAVIQREWFTFEFPVCVHQMDDFNIIAADWKMDTASVSMLSFPTKFFYLLLLLQLSPISFADFIIFIIYLEYFLLGLLMWQHEMHVWNLTRLLFI